MEFFKIAEMERGSEPTHDGPNLVMFAVDHGIPFPLEWSAAPFFHAYVDEMGETEAIAEAVDGQDLAPGTYVAELEFVDDGPSDWPGGRECRLDARNIRRATPAEWRAHVGGEWVFPRDDGATSSDQDGAHESQRLVVVPEQEPDA